MTIRDDIIAFYTQHQCSGLFAKKRLLIRTPISLVENLNPSGKHFDLFDPTPYTSDDNENYIYLRIFPNYDQENDFIGDGGLRNTFGTAAVFAHSNVRRGFKATVGDRRPLILNIIRRLVDISGTTSYQRFSPIKVIDFCLPEAGETTAFGGETATVRWGAIKLDNPPGFVKNNYLKDDWTFTFKEANLRLN